MIRLFKKYFFKEINTFIQQENIKLIKISSKESWKNSVTFSTKTLSSAMFSKIDDKKCFLSTKSAYWNDFWIRHIMLKIDDWWLYCCYLLLLLGRLPSLRPWKLLTAVTLPVIETVSEVLWFLRVGQQLVQNRAAQLTGSEKQRGEESFYEATLTQWI